MAVGVILNPDVAYIDCRIEYSVSTDAANNKSTVTATFRVRSTSTGGDSIGTANFKVFIKDSSGTTVDTATRTSSTTIPADSTWRTYATASHVFSHSTTDGTLSFYVGGGTNSGSDPLVGSGWNSLPAETSSLISGTNYQLYPVVPSYTIQRTNANLSSNTSTISLGTSPSTSITSSTGIATGGTATITRLYAKSATATSDSGLTYTSFSSTFSASPLERVWVKITSTADGVTVNNSGTSTADIGTTLYGYPSPPSSISLSKSGRQVTVTYGNSATNGGYSTSPTYTVQRSSNNGSSWQSHSNSDLLTPATTYIFRVYATNNTGSSLYTQSGPIFISAYGSRFTSSTTTTPISSAKVFIGIGESGADENGWKVISNIKRYTESGWIDLQT